MLSYYTDNFCPLRLDGGKDKTRNNRMEISQSWKESKLLKPVISARARRTAVAANARHPASPLAKQAAALQTRNARIKRNNFVR